MVDSKKIKILLFISSLGGGGAERTIVNIANGLVDRNYEVIIITAKNGSNVYEEFLSYKVKLETLNCSRTKYSVLRLAKSIKRINPDLIFSTLNFSNIVAFIANVISLSFKPVIVREATNRAVIGEVSIFNRLITSFVYNRVNRVIALSNGVKEEIVRHFWVKHSKVSVIYNPVDIEKIIELKNENVIDYEFSNSFHHIIALGRLHPHKDFLTLIKALQIAKESVNIKLLIVGDGNQKKMLKNYCDENDLNDLVSFLGFKSNPYKYINRSAILVLSSIVEGFGHVIIEAMSLGVPVISTNCMSGPKEIIKNNQYGEIVAVGDFNELAKKIVYLLKNDQRRKELSDLGKKRSKDFKLDSIVAQYEVLFSSAINKSRFKQSRLPI